MNSKLSIITKIQAVIKKDPKEFVWFQYNKNKMRGGWESKQVKTKAAMQDAQIT